MVAGRGAAAGLKRLLPKQVKRAIRRYLARTHWYPGSTTQRSNRATPRALRHLVVNLPAPPPGGPAAGSRPPGPLRIDCPTYMFIPRKLCSDGLGRYEPYALDCFLALVECSVPGAVMDVGANVGLYGLLASAYSDREVHCFEPAPDTAQVARDSAAASGLTMHVAAIALGDDAGAAMLYLSDSTDASNSLNPAFRVHKREIVVPLEKLDHYVARTRLEPSIIKIDTETTEPDVLAGAQESIRRYRPWILVEVLWSQVEDRLHAVMDQFDYTYYHLNGPGPRPATQRIVGDATWTHYMYLLAPHPVDDAFWDRMNAWRQALETATIDSL